MEDTLAEFVGLALVTFPISSGKLLQPVDGRWDAFTYIYT